MSLPWMGAIGMQVIRDVTIPCPCCVSISGGQAWPIRCSNPLSPVHIACNMRATCPKCLYTPIVATALNDLLHVDFTSTEMTLELNRLPKVTNVLVFHDHFMKHVMAYVTPIRQLKQSPSSCIRVTFQSSGPLPGYWVIRVLSSQAASLMRCVNSLGVKKLWTMLYHPQTNGLVERSHQTIMRMTGKLGEDKKANLPRHLAEIVHAYNAIQSAMTGYSPHYLMFGHRPRLPVDFYFPWEAPLPSVWMNMWQLSMTNWGLPSGKLRPSQQQKPKDRNGTMTQR